jgi:hypothetical protein
MRARMRWFLVVMVVACGGGGTAQTARAPRETADEWSKTSWERRHDVMTFTVLPNMGRLFQGFRGTTAPDLTCRSCHGKDAEAVGYKMPHGLPPLDPRRLPDESSSDPRIAKMAKFMREEVTPQMADLIGVGVADVSCFTCHPREERPE